MLGVTSWGQLRLERGRAHSYRRDVTGGDITWRGGPALYLYTIEIQVEVISLRKSIYDMSPQGEDVIHITPYSRATPRCFFGETPEIHSKGL